MDNMHAPLLYQINTRVRMTELSRTLGMFATLDDIADTAWSYHVFDMRMI